MNCYLITNPAEEYVSLILSCFDKLKKVKTFVIKSEEAFRRESFKGAFKNPSDTDTVFVVPELNWKGDFSVKSGYKYAEELIDTKLKDKDFFNLIFISLFTRDQLLRMVGAEYVELVKAFPHICLLDFGPDKALPLPRSCTKVHFDLLKRLVISKSGRLDFLKHQVYHIADRELKDVPQKAGDILDILALPSYGGDTEDAVRVISSLRVRTGQVKDKEDVIKLVSDIRSYIDIVKEKIQGQTAIPKEFFKVLIVEDDDNYRRKLVRFFEKYFYKVTSFGDEAIVRAEDEIRSAAGNYDVVILDLMYSTNGEDRDILPFNGLDLYRILREEEINKDIAAYEQEGSTVRKAAVRIVTSVPRNDIMSFDARAPRIFTKGNGWDQLTACMADRMDELFEECRVNYQRYLMGQPHCPKRGIFTRYGMMETLNANRDTIFAQALDYAKLVERDRKMPRFALPSPGEDNPQVFLDHLDAIMAHRRLVINYLLDNDGIFNTNGFAEFLRGFLPEKADPVIDRNYLTTKLGFSATTQPGPDINDRTKNSGGQAYWISLKDSANFFEEEFELLNAAEEDYPVVVRWIKMVHKFFSDCMKEDYLDFCKSEYAGDPVVPDFLAALEKSGIKKFVTGDVSSESFLSLLFQTKRYLADRNESCVDRQWIQDLFADELIGPEELSANPEALPGLYDVLTEKFTQISDAFFAITSRQ